MYFKKHINAYGCDKKRKFPDNTGQNVLIKNDSDEINDEPINFDDNECIIYPEYSFTFPEIGFCLDCVRNIIQKTIK